MINKDDSEENDLWHHVTRDVTPLPKERRKNAQIKQEPKKINIKKTCPKKHCTDPITNQTTQVHPPQIDRATNQRLRRGQIQIDGRIDLHGMSQNQAYDALIHYIPTAYHSGKRCILVITGKGMAKSGNIPLAEQTIGILKQRTPEWLSEAPLNQYVLKIEQAKPKDGGAGALYVLLKRNRKSD